MPKTTSKPASGTRAAAARSASHTLPARRVLLLVATRKGAWLYDGDDAERTWRVDGPHFLGHIINHLVLRPRRADAAGCGEEEAGHLGPTIFRSEDLGQAWKEAARPPAFIKSAENGRTVDHTFLADAGARQRAGHPAWMRW